MVMPDRHSIAPHANTPGELQELISTLTESIKLAASIPQERRLADKAWMKEYFGVKATALDRIIATPGFPKAIKIANGPLRWKAQEVMDWAEDQAASRIKRADRRSA